jgi:hypothetical protein
MGAMSTAKTNIVLCIAINFNVRHDYGETPFVMAIEKGLCEAVQLWIFEIEMAVRPWHGPSASG